MALDKLWASKTELRAVVKAYVKIRDLQMQGKKVVKEAEYRQLVQKHGRSDRAFLYRMKNISRVYEFMGRPWADGLTPAGALSVETAEEIERLICKIEGRAAAHVASFEKQVLEYIRGEFEQVPEGKAKPKYRKVTSTQYDRDPKLAAYVRKMAKGKCELCRSKAPFIKPNGLPYLEVHHLWPLADHGPDTIENTVALCPNCHRELHHGRNQEKLRKQVCKRKAG